MCVFENRFEGLRGDCSPSFSETRINLALPITQIRIRGKKKECCVVVRIGRHILRTHTDPRSSGWAVMLRNKNTSDLVIHQ